jgi:hypothetical protein
MRKVLLILAALAVLLVATPAMAQDGYDYLEMGTFSIGLGGGFGDTDTDIGPLVISGKYWDPMWELGAELYTDGSFSDSDEYDQIGMAWLAYRYDLSVEEQGAAYIGIGGAGVFEIFDDNFENSFGPVALVGWDGEEWGLELKYGWFDPSLISIVAYYHFDTNE